VPAQTTGTPGVVFTEATLTNPGQFSVNGQRTNANYFLVDSVGANASTSTSATSYQQAAGSLPNLTVFGGTNSLVSVDALEEFRVHTSTYAAEFGRTPGAHVSLVTRSGTNHFTARIFEYFRNDAMDAGDGSAMRSRSTSCRCASTSSAESQAARCRPDRV
jgi:hypothetical protein